MCVVDTQISVQAAVSDVDVRGGNGISTFTSLETRGLRLQFPKASTLVLDLLLRHTRPHPNSYGTSQAQEHKC